LGWSGVAYVVLIGASEAVDDRSVAQALDGAAIGCLVVFLGALRAALRRREGEAGALSAVAVIAGSVVAAVELLDPENARVVLAFPTAALVLAASVAVLTTAALPRPHGWAGIVVAVAQAPAGFAVASSGAFSPDGVVPVVAFVLFLGWIAATSVALTRAR
jgi:hypothetical protein